MGDADGRGCSLWWISVRARCHCFGAGCLHVVCHRAAPAPGTLRVPAIEDASAAAFVGLTFNNSWLHVLRLAPPGAPTALCLVATRLSVCFLLSYDWHAWAGHLLAAQVTFRSCDLNVCSKRNVSRAQASDELAVKQRNPTWQQTQGHRTTVKLRKVPVA